uniref:Putative secreted protein n=1 Tax=Ixodes ricinus TaxID=34613 RepID=A0A147BM97_IXORI
MPARATCTGRCWSWRAGWATWCWLESGWPPSGAAPACSRCSSGPWSACSGTTLTGTTWSTSARQTSPSSRESAWKSSWRQTWGPTSSSPTARTPRGSSASRPWSAHSTSVGAACGAWGPGSCPGA